MPLVFKESENKPSKENASGSEGVLRTPSAIGFSCQQTPIQALFTSKEYLEDQESKKSPYKYRVKDIAKLLDKYHEVADERATDLSEQDRIKMRLIKLHFIELAVYEWSRENKIPYEDRFVYPNLHMQQEALRQVQLERIEIMKILRANREMMPPFYILYNPLASSTFARKEEENEMAAHFAPVWKYLVDGGIRCSDEAATPRDVLETELMANLSSMLLTGTGKYLLDNLHAAQNARVDFKRQRHLDSFKKNLYLVNKKISRYRDKDPEPQVTGKWVNTEFIFEMPFAWELGRYMSPAKRRKPTQSRYDSQLCFHPPSLQLALIMQKYLQMMSGVVGFEGQWRDQLRKGDQSKELAEEYCLPDFAKMDRLPIVDTMQFDTPEKDDWMLIELERSLSAPLEQFDLTLPQPYAKAGQKPGDSLVKGLRTSVMKSEVAKVYPTNANDESLFMQSFGHAKPRIVRDFDSPAFEWLGKDSDSFFRGTLVKEPLDKMEGKVQVNLPSHQGNRSAVFILRDESGNELVVKFLKEGSFSEDASKEAFSANFLKAFGTPSLRSQACVMLRPDDPKWERLNGQLETSPNAQKFSLEFKASFAKRLPYILIMEKAGGKPLNPVKQQYGESPRFLQIAGELSFFDLLFGNHDRVISGIYAMNLHHDPELNQMHVVDHILNVPGMAYCIQSAQGYRANMGRETENFENDPAFKTTVMGDFERVLADMYQAFISGENTSLSQWARFKSNESPMDRVHFMDCNSFDIGIVTSALSLLRMNKQIEVLIQQQFTGKDDKVLFFLELCRAVNQVTKNHEEQLKAELHSRKSKGAS
ncbi:hypothetical protein [Aureibacter tunicatorum]|uniref:Uncharacterized protein n=1 Tax=Aureibacter tunicatorum TaxID=866807 RepID=A0AAE3XQW1_9BACT|nr:hypothetical protein [Aureibacter tunicatorum]MDR6241098.1 hypothetical protein [Aureibacter tunicatorum]BDD03876.1 hypothetical protein AUTU_13590 [Aureibacter tunicatorum]